PRVVGADDGAAAAVALEEPGAPVAAGVGEGADAALSIAHQEEGGRRRVDGEVAPGLRYLVGARHEVPARREDALDLAGVELRRAAAPRGQGFGRPDRPAHAAVVRRIEEIHGNGHALTGEGLVRRATSASASRS